MNPPTLQEISDDVYERNSFRRNAPTATQEEIEADRNWEFRRLREDAAVTTSSHRGVLSFEQVVNAARAAMEEE